jgi:hypothetical protein
MAHKKAGLFTFLTAEKLIMGREASFSITRLPGVVFSVTESTIRKLSLSRTLDDPDTVTPRFVLSAIVTVCAVIRVAAAVSLFRVMLNLAGLVPVTLTVSVPVPRSILPVTCPPLTVTVSFPAPVCMA